MPNPIFFEGNQFKCKKTVDRSMEVAAYNSNSAESDRILTLPNRLAVNVGCFVGRCCNSDDNRVSQLQNAYAELINMIQTHVPGMPDHMNKQPNGEPKR